LPETVFVGGPLKLLGVALEVIGKKKLFEEREGQQTLGTDHGNIFHKVFELAGGLLFKRVLAQKVGALWEMRLTRGCDRVISTYHDHLLEIHRLSVLSWLLAHVLGHPIAQHRSRHERTREKKLRRVFGAKGAKSSKVTKPPRDGCQSSTEQQTTPTKNIVTK
jgi:hypothetical protein